MEYHCFTHSFQCDQVRAWPLSQVGNPVVRCQHVKNCNAFMFSLQEEPTSPAEEESPPQQEVPTVLSPQEQAPTEAPSPAATVIPPEAPSPAATVIPGPQTPPRPKSPSKAAPKTPPKAAPKQVPPAAADESQQAAEVLRQVAFGVASKLTMWLSMQPSRLHTKWRSMWPSRSCTSRFWPNPWRHCSQ